MKPFKLFERYIIGLYFIFFFLVTVNAQTSIASSESRELNNNKRQYVKLSDALKELKFKFAIDILYEEKTISGLTTENISLKSDESIEQYLMNILSPLHLSFNKVKENTYIIVKNRNINKVLGNQNPIAEVYGNKENQVEKNEVSKLKDRQLPNSKLVVTELMVSGTVTDINGNPLEGASVRVKGATIGTKSDSKGYFKIQIRERNAILLIEYIGYVPKSLFVEQGRIYNIKLQLAAKELEDVVIVGYGSVRKSDLTGSVSKIKTEGSETVPTISIDQYLQGRVSGLQIISNSGAPGSSMSFLIRGASSITGSSQPLIILDGFPVETSDNALSANRGQDGWTSSTPAANPLAAINPNDIESIEVLKDASSSAIYGSRGANGVVIITTKRGKFKKDQIVYNIRTDVSKIPKQLKMLNSAQFMEYANEANKNSGLDSAFRSSAIATNLQTDNNWQDLIYQTALSSEHQLSISGGDEKTKYFISANYANQTGVVKNSEFTRGSFRANIERQISDKLKISTGITGSLNVNLSAQQSNPNGNPAGSVVTGALTFRPFTAPFLNTDELEPNTLVSGNPLTLIQKAKNLAKAEVYLLNFKGEYKINQFLTFLANGGFNTTSSARSAFLPTGTFQGDQQNGVAYYGQNKNSNYLIENTLTFSKTISQKNRINAVAGYTWQEWSVNTFGVQASGFSTQVLGYNNLSLANTSTIPSNSYQQWGLSSFLGRLNYAHNNRYLLTLTGRSDGATRLADGNKWAFFPSAALGWNMHNEKFLSNQKFLKELKLRASYGLVGNQNVEIGSNLDRFGSVRTVIGGNIVNGLAPSGLGNSNLKWEITDQFNIGVDASVLKGDLKIGLEYYKRITNNLLINIPLAASNGFTSYVANGGKLTNTGIELEFMAKLLTKKITWLITGNITSNENAVNELSNGVVLFGQIYSGGVSVNQPISTAVVGQPIGVFFGYVTDGIYQTFDEIAKGPTPLGTPLPGDIRFKDINKDGKINSEDRTFIGRPFPKYAFGVTHELSYKNWGLTLFIMGSIGQKIANLNRLQLANLNYLSVSNVLKEAWDKRWNGEGTSNFYPAPRAKQTASYQNMSDFLIEDGSFVRLKNVTLFCSINSKAIKFIKSAKLFVSATNLLTFTNYKGYDPEVSANGNSSLNRGVDMGTIPQFRTISFGFNVSL